MDKSKVPNPKFEQKLTVPNGVTEDIVSEILRVYQKYLPQLKEFAQGFQVPCRCPEKIAKKIWYWIKDNIKYKRDPKGVQYIKSPARTIWDGYGDCKTYSIVAMSILHHLGIKAKFRFTSYSDEKPLHHVYVVIPHGKGEILLDAVWHTFNSEKTPIIKKRDIMPEIYEVAGVAAVGEIGEIANAMESIKQEIHKEIKDMRAFLNKFSINEKEKQIIANVDDTFGSGLFSEAILRAIEESEIKIFYTTILHALRMAEAPSKAEIGVLPLAAGLAAGRGIVRFVQSGGLRKVGNTVKGIVKRIKERKPQRQAKRAARKQRRQERRQARQNNFYQAPEENFAPIQEELPQANFETSNDFETTNGFETSNDFDEVGRVNINQVSNTLKNVFSRLKKKPISKKLQRVQPKRRLLGRLVDKAKTKIKEIQQRSQERQQTSPEAMPENLQQENQVLARQITAETNQETITTQNTGANATQSNNNNTLLFVVAGAAALFFLSKK
jgi:hypothetical protein